MGALEALMASESVEADRLCRRVIGIGGRLLVRSHARANPLALATLRKGLQADQSSHRASLDELSEAAPAGWAGWPGAAPNP